MSCPVLTSIPHFGESVRAWLVTWNGVSKLCFRFVGCMLPTNEGWNCHALPFSFISCDVLPCCCVRFVQFVVLCFRCIPCPAGSYCLPASVNATGECPPGFDCSSGIIAVPIGFWSPAVNISAASNVGNASIYPCFTRTACQGGNASVGAVCAAGYVGPLCATCASGWAGHAGVCQHCLPRGVLAFGLTAVGLLLSCTLGLAVAIILQSDSPSDPLVRVPTMCTLAYCARLSLSSLRRRPSACCLR